MAGILLLSLIAFCITLATLAAITVEDYVYTRAIVAPDDCVYTRAVFALERYVNGAV